MQNKIDILGCTADGKIVVGGIGKFYFQYGLPLCFAFDVLDNRGFIPSWVHLFQELRDNGMSDKRIFHLLNEHVFETYGKEFRNVVIERLNLIFAK